jgi:raffinose/stachyose/melibiose transport system substrate-binding protein
VRGKKFLSEIGWFPFPSVPGAPGNSQVLLGGGDGNSCSKSAPEPACADFLAYLESTPSQRLLVSTANVGLPANPAASSALTLPAEQQILQAGKHTPYIQEYFDLAYPTNVGTALDSAVANLFASKGTPQSIVTAIDQAAARQ